MNKIKCDFCNMEDSDSIIATITGKKKSVRVCPNCQSEFFDNLDDDLMNDPKFLDEITGEHGAIEFRCGKETYRLHKPAMMRLIANKLRPYEWKILCKKHNYPEQFQFMLHDDFYDESGFAYQPCADIYSIDAYDNITELLDEAQLEDYSYLSKDASVYFWLMWEFYAQYNSVFAEETNNILVDALNCMEIVAGTKPASSVGCDSCGFHLSTDYCRGMAPTKREAVQWAKDVGFRVINGNTLCPRCVHTGKRIQKVQHRQKYLLN